MNLARFLLLLPAAAALAAPAEMVVVSPGNATSVYWQTDEWWLAPTGTAPLARLDPDPDLPVFLVLEQRPGSLDEARQKTTPLFDDGKTLIVQAAPADAELLGATGVAIVRVPDEPHAAWAPDERSLPRAFLADTFIQRVVRKVSPDSIRRRIRRLEDFRSRYSFADSCRASERHIRDYFASLGLDSTELFAYTYQGDTWYDPIGTLRGSGDPSRVVVVCGHLDAITYGHPYDSAPGAEDNASGTAMAMEAARVLAAERTDYTVKFIGFSGEEQGLIGSLRYAQQMRAQGADIVGVLNFDMIAYPGGENGVALFCNASSRPLADFEGRMCDLYTTIDHVVVTGSYGSDQLSFHQYGYRATAGAEYGSSYPWYHTTGDTIGNLSMALAAEVAKMAVASATMLAVAPAPPESFALRDLGLSGSLHASWTLGTESDLAGYKLYWGTTSGVYTDSLTVGRVSATRINGLANGTRYYAAVVARDSAGHESGFSSEQSAIPGLVPLAPAGSLAMPASFSMDIFWRQNGELDLAGYNLHRSTRSGSGYTRLNSVLLTDTTYGDTALLSDTMYYYVATAVDTQGYESDSSVEVRGKPITLDHGVLLVDETRDGNGQPGSPSDAQQDGFYHEILRGFSLTDWDVAQQGVPIAGDVGPYSTVVWHADEYQQQQLADAVPGIVNYLDCNGRLWLIGWKPALGMMGSGRYPYDFAAGQFPYDQLHLGRAEQSLISDFTGATGSSGYPDMVIDSTKTLPALHGRLPFIDALLPRDAEAVLAFNSYSGDTFAGKPVGVRWLGGPHRAVALGFPLYYTHNDEARELAIKVLTDLGEPYGVAEQRPVNPGRISLVLGPNPTRSVVRISYALPSAGRVRLNVCDITGRIVAELVNGNRPAGTHAVSWRPAARGAATGVYFCRLSSSGSSLTTRVEVIR